MSGDDLKSRDYRDRSRISFDQSSERQYWTDKWQISDKQLQEAIEQTDSNMITDIENYLRNHKYIE